MPSSTAFYRLVALSQPVSPPQPALCFLPLTVVPCKPKIRAQPVPASPEPTSFARGARRRRAGAAPPVSFHVPLLPFSHHAHGGRGSPRSRRTMFILLQPLFIAHKLL